MANGSHKNGGRNHNKLYGWLRRRLAEEARHRRPMLGKNHTPETRAKISAASKGRPKSKEHRAALSISKMGLSPNRGAGWKSNHAAAMRRIANTRDLNFTQSPEYRAAQSAKMKLIWAERRALKTE